MILCFLVVERLYFSPCRETKQRAHLNRAKAAHEEGQRAAAKWEACLEHYVLKDRANTSRNKRSENQKLSILTPVLAVSPEFFADIAVASIQKNRSREPRLLWSRPAGFKKPNNIPEKVTFPDFGIV
jgi:hypothetical protein